MGPASALSTLSLSTLCQFLNKGKEPESCRVVISTQKSNYNCWIRESSPRCYLWNHLRPMRPIECQLCKAYAWRSPLNSVYYRNVIAPLDPPMARLSFRIISCKGRACQDVDPANALIWNTKWAFKIPFISYKLKVINIIVLRLACFLLLTLSLLCWCFSEGKLAVEYLSGDGSRELFTWVQW